MGADLRSLGFRVGIPGRVRGMLHERKFGFVVENLNQYQITGSLGAGGMGEVFRPRDTRLNQVVAVKTLPKTFASDPDRLRRFEQEAKTLTALNHPNILTTHDACVHEGAPYLVSELLEGQTLWEVLGGNQGTSLPLRRAGDYALQIAYGLAAAHSKGLGELIRLYNQGQDPSANIALIEHGLGHDTQALAWMEQCCLRFILVKGRRGEPGMERTPPWRRPQRGPG
jgi:serine/threonine protein kinase